MYPIKLLAYKYAQFSKKSSWAHGLVLAILFASFAVVGYQVLANEELSYLSLVPVQLLMLGLLALASSYKHQMPN
ncbi:hypothetical protein [Vibrio sp. SCSIO 43136]|uniref:hypothetical protein n=1 Tax=Vibrio sp. SCSIO 43136 TaxID=2819101 RepID=UPI002075E823|nr:hypothetical protein [Vibrio sp. SCSIO 43136]USD67695.1 hypothetical protein J4N39_16025 [Vibrio sp. SCSIO 43136]